MTKPYFVPIMGSVPSLMTTTIEPPENPIELLVQSHAMYRRFAVQIVDTGLDTFGIQAKDYLIFREQRWPTNEGQICLITMGDEITIRMMEYINNPMVTLRVGADQISELELATTDFCVIGVLDDVIKEELATFAEPLEETLDWGC